MSLCRGVISLRNLATIAGASLLVLVVFLLVAPQFANRRGAFREVGSTLFDSDSNQLPILASGLSALKADYNHGVIVKAAQYMKAFGSNTSVFRGIARIAANADHQCPKLFLVLDLAARSTSNAARILALAESACRLKNPQDEIAWQAFYDHMSEMAAFPSVEAALAAQVSK